MEGRGRWLQTIAAYIDLNPVRAGTVGDPKDYRYCGYAEAVAGGALARDGLQRIWAGFGGDPLQVHRRLLFGKGPSPWAHKGEVMDRAQAVQVLEVEQGRLSKTMVLRCRVRYFTDGVIFGSTEFVRGFADAWQQQRKRKFLSRTAGLRGADWGDLVVIRGLRKEVFG